MIKDKNYWLFDIPVAHRGLWGGNITENTLTAYKNAADNGFPFEIDVFLTADGEPVSFHDDNLLRMTGVDALIYEKTLEELKSIPLYGTDEKIPTLKEVLDVTDGKVPILIELKDQPNGAVVDKVAEILKDYKGDFAVQSFNPFYLIRLKKIAPQFVRGVLGTHLKNRGGLTDLVIKKMPFNFIIKPDFISYHKDGLSYIKRKIRKTPAICWTVTDKTEKERLIPPFKNIIFENFTPKKK